MNPSSSSATSSSISSPLSTATSATSSQQHGFSSSAVALLASSLAPGTASSASSSEPSKKKSRRNKRGHVRKRSSGGGGKAASGSFSPELGDLVEALPRVSSPNGDQHSEASEDVQQDWPVFAAAGKLLEQEIEDFFARQQPSAAERTSREAVIARIQRAVNQIQTRNTLRPQNGYTVYPFGSTLTGIDTAGSDLDLCIVDNDMLDGFEGKLKRERLPALHDMRALAHVLRKSGFVDVVPVVNAAVPICKWVSRFTGIEIVGDANCNEQLGLLNSQLIAEYCNLCPMLRRISVFVKHWAKSRDLNDPAGDHGPISVSSYTYVLMIIAYLQHLDVLPNLQSPERVRHVEPQTFWSRPRYHEKRGKPHDVTWTRPLEDDYEHASRVSLYAAVEGFFRYFATGFDPDDEIVSIVRGGIVPRSHDARIPPQRDSPPPRWTSEDESEDEEVLYQGDPQVARHSVLVETALEASASARLHPPSMHNGGAHSSESGDDASYTPDRAREAAEVMNWPHPLVVQDPFMLARNTACNVEPRVYDRLHDEFLRAHDLIQTGRTFAEICKPIYDEPAYVARQAERDAARRPPRTPFRPPSPSRPAVMPQGNGAEDQQRGGGRGMPAWRARALGRPPQRGRGGSPAATPPPTSQDQQAFPALPSSPPPKAKGRGRSRGRGRAEAQV